MTSCSRQIEATIKSYIIDYTDLVGEILAQLYKPLCQFIYSDLYLALRLKVYLIEVLTRSWTLFNNFINNQSVLCSLVSNIFDPLLEDSLSVFIIYRVVEELLEYILVQLIIEIVGEAEDLVTPVVSKINYTNK